MSTKDVSKTYCHFYHRLDSDAPLITTQLITVSIIIFSSTKNYSIFFLVIEVVDSSEINISVLSKAMENGRISHTPSKEALNQLDYGFISETDERRISRQSSSDCSDDVFLDTDLFPSELDRVAPFSNCYPTTGWHQFLVLSRRMGKQAWRNKVGKRSIIFWGQFLFKFFLDCNSDSASAFALVRLDGRNCV